MRIIKTIAKNNFALEHSRFINDKGFLVDSFVIKETTKEGNIINYPFRPLIKIKDLKEIENLFNTTTDYTDEEYNQIFEKEVKKCQRK